MIGDIFRKPAELSREHIPALMLMQVFLNNFRRYFFYVGPDHEF